MNIFGVNIYSGGEYFSGVNMIIPISCQTPYCDIALWTEIWWTWTWKTRTGVNTFPAKYILRVNIFQDEYFSEVNLSQE